MAVSACAFDHVFEVIQNKIALRVNGRLLCVLYAPSPTWRLAPFSSRFHLLFRSIHITYNHLFCLTAKFSQFKCPHKLWPGLEAILRAAHCAVYFIINDSNWIESTVCRFVRTRSPNRSAHIFYIQPLLIRVFLFGFFFVAVCVVVVGLTKD